MFILSVCDEGRWGENCLETCDCVHGTCDAATGRCDCTSGWGGAACNTGKIRSVKIRGVKYELLVR